MNLAELLGKIQLLRQPSAEEWRKISDGRYTCIVRYYYRWKIVIKEESGCQLVCLFDGRGRRLIIRLVGATGCLVVSDGLDIELGRVTVKPTDLGLQLVAGTMSDRVIAAIEELLPDFK